MPARHRRPRHPLAARQGARRIELDQRHAVCARQSRRLRRLGADGLPRLELRRCAAVFRKSEHYVQGGDAEYRGKGGPLRVEDYRTILPLTHRFVEAAQQAGFAFSTDLNGRMQEGVGYSQMTRKGRFRGSTARTFLARGQKRREPADRDRRDGDAPAAGRQALHRRRLPPARAWTTRRVRRAR